MINRLHALVAFTCCLAAQVSVADDKSPAPQGNLRDAAWFKQADKDGDGRLSREEAPNKAVFDDVDTDGDGFASVKELQVWLAKRPQRVTQPTPDRGEQNPPAAAPMDQGDGRRR